ncbi:hypothetical protein PN462_07300 [Spirulina sp. CS-785/01]|uniref:hypothetical protein n=1 Tax=Spirulina sp. CS-785/01 TaxID=3021716 RepID=UPI00232DE21F|nr:hypothetical protein [Spirulina sp. CS-785/01]MDB9312902.1 hypothetical protein [Spirulina sp. CS-785/01]
MSESNKPNETNQTETRTSEINPETRALVDQKMPNESDEIRYHMMSLIDAIKQQTEDQLESAGDMTREAYVEAMRQAQNTLQNTGLLLDEQRESLEKTITGIEDTATQQWETFVNEFQNFSDRFERAVDAAWKILTEPESNTSSSSTPTSTSTNTQSSTSDSEQIESK